MQALSTPSGLDNPFKSRGPIRSAVTHLYKCCFISSHFSARSIIEFVVGEFAELSFQGRNFGDTFSLLTDFLEALKITQQLMFFRRREDNQCL